MSAILLALGYIDAAASGVCVFYGNFGVAVFSGITAIGLLLQGTSLAIITAVEKNR